MIKVAVMGSNSKNEECNKTGPGLRAGRPGDQVVSLEKPMLIVTMAWYLWIVKAYFQRNLLAITMNKFTQHREFRMLVPRIVLGRGGEITMLSIIIKIFYKGQIEWVKS